MTTCDLVAERIALGEPLGDAAEHAATCARCRSLVALPTELGATRREADPGLGFTARMTAGAQQRLVVRRRRRLAAGLSAAIVASSLGVFLMTRQPEVTPLPLTTPPVATGTQQHDPWEDSGEGDDDVRQLMHYANADATYHANWARIGKPLAPYRAVLQGVDR